MTSELTYTIISAIAGAFAGGIVTLILDKRKERREDKKEKQNEKKKIYEDRPELQIIKYKEYISRPGHKLKKECDINVFMTKMGKVSVEDDIVTAYYNKDYFNEEEWCCVIYDFKNVGKTDVEKYQSAYFTVPYEKGTLKAIGYRNGKQVECIIETADDASCYEISSESCENKEEKITIFTVEAKDWSSVSYLDK